MKFMEYTKKEDFQGGYIEYFIPEIPKYENKKWTMKVYAKVIASGYSTQKNGRQILLKKGFTTNGNKENEFYKYFTILEGL